jgi:hypothetical protein
MAVSVLIHGSEIWTIKQEAKIGTLEITFFMSVAGYKCKDQIRNTKISELNILKLNNKILKSRLQWKYHVLQMENRRIPKKIFNIKLRKKTKNRVSTVKPERPTYFSRGRNRSSTA